MLLPSFAPNALQGAVSLLSVSFLYNYLRAQDMQELASDMLACTFICVWATNPSYLLGVGCCGLLFWFAGTLDAGSLHIKVQNMQKTHT